MNKNRPYFSVLMPTYNRGHLISKAIKSVLQQTFGDLELVISNGGSTDNTKEIVAGFNDSRIRYIESEKRLSIGDNYQNALAHATGEYVSFLSDDDVFVPVTLARVKRVIDDYNAQTVAFHVSQYVHDGDYEHQIYTPANSLEIPLFTGQVSGFKSQEALRLLFSNFGFGGKTQHENFIVSYLANAVYHHTIFERLRARKKHLFATTPADMYLAGAVLSVVDTYFCLSEPLHVWSRWGGKSSASPPRQADKFRQQ